MHPTPEYPLVFHCGHPGTYPSIQEGAKLEELLERISQTQKCLPCNRAMHYQPPAGASDAELYADWYARNCKPPIGDHAAHYNRDIEWLAHPGNCKGGRCLRKKLRWMAAQSELSHIGRNGRRLAQIHGVKR